MVEISNLSEIAGSTVARVVSSGRHVKIVLVDPKGEERSLICVAHGTLFDERGNFYATDDLPHVKTVFAE